MKFTLSSILIVFVLATAKADEAASSVKIGNVAPYVHVSPENPTIYDEMRRKSNEEMHSQIKPGMTMKEISVILRAQRDKYSAINQLEEDARVAALPEAERAEYYRQLDAALKSSANSAEDWRQQEERLENNTRNLIANAPSMPPEKAIPALAGEMVNRSTYYNDRFVVESPFFYPLRDHLYAIPGHAEYFVGELERHRLKMLEDSKIPSYRGVPNYTSYDNRRETVFEKLSRMQTPEAVRVLGEMLTDLQEIHALCEPGEGPSGIPNAILAYNALKRLKVSGIPQGLAPSSLLSPEELAAMPLKERFERDLVRWKEWYAELKSGQRTYHFEGSAIEYNWDGTIAATPPKRKEREHSVESSKTALVTAPSRNTLDPKEGRKDNWLIIMVATIAGLLLVIAGWKVFAKPKPAN